LIGGVSGTGKTSVRKELQRLGYHVINGDRELVYQGDPETGIPTGGVEDGTTYEQYMRHVHEHHIWDVDKVKALVAIQD